MASINRLDTADSTFQSDLRRLLAYDASQDESIERATADILARVEHEGDTALLEFTRRFDHVQAESVAELEIDRSEWQAALDALPSDQRSALEAAAERIRRYHEHQVTQSWSYTEDDGTVLGQKITPLDRVGLYVPGGKAAYPSSVLMNAIPAKVAGVPEVIMVTPTPGGVRNPIVLAAAAIGGVDRVWGIGGAQAVAALAYGTQTLSPVDKIVGPGNAYVAAAKRRVFGQVGIDMIAGPSEILIVADAENDPAWLAVDLLSQAEHDEAAQAILIADDAGFAARVETEVQRALATLPRAAIARASWERHGAIILVRDVMTDAPALVDRLAPEHVELAVADPDALAKRIRHAGAIFLGRHSPEAVGDYVAGPNHVLPTARSARFSSGLSTLDFMKRTSLIRCSPEGLAAIGPAAIRLAEAEGLPAHARSVAIRLNRRS